MFGLIPSRWHRTCFAETLVPIGADMNLVYTNAHLHEKWRVHWSPGYKRTPALVFAFDSCTFYSWGASLVRVKARRSIDEKV